MNDWRPVGSGIRTGWKVPGGVLGVVLCVMATGWSVGVWGRAMASPPPGSVSRKAGRGTGVVELPRWRTTKLGRILVVGHRIRIPKLVVFEIIKAALKRTWSTSPRDGNQIVCQFHYPMGSHIQDQAVLFCQTNNEHFQFQERHWFMNISGRDGGAIPGTIRGPLEFQEFQTDQMHLVDPGRLRRLLAKLPAAGGRYEFEVTKHGHPESEWFMNRGKVVKVIYFRKKAKASLRSKPGR